ncbi:hypothetical protein [Paenibacillus illinoisensis]|uniref:hypothetical protein n=1 Tax=Paenibacillus illinoisensis TaxID=59845 RepID=UPI00301C424D
MNDYGKKVQQKKEYKQKRMGQTLIYAAAGFFALNIALLIKPSVGFLWFMGIWIILSGVLIGMLEARKIQKYVAYAISVSWLISVPMFLNGDFNIWVNLGIGLFLFLWTLGAFQEWAKYTDGNVNL